MTLIQTHVRFSLTVLIVLVALGAFFAWATPFTVSVSDGVALVADVAEGCCGGGGGDGDGGGGGGDGGDFFFIPDQQEPPQKVQKDIPAPKCNISVSPTTVVDKDQATLSWSSENAVRVDISHVGNDIDKNGSTQVEPDHTVTYDMTVTNSAGAQVHCDVTLKVVPREEPPKEEPPKQEPPKQEPDPTCSLSLSAKTVSFGGSTTANWNSNNATSASLTDAGSVGTSGSFTFSNITSTKTFVLTVSGPGGSATCQDTVTVTQEPNQPSCTISANPTNVPFGGSTTVNWSSNNATSATLTDAGPVGTSGSFTFGNITNNRTFTLTVNGPGGSATCQTSVSSTQQQQTPSCSIFANPSSVNFGGSTTVTWNSNNANSAILTDIGSVSTSGSQTFSNITGTRTFTLVVSGPGGTNTCQTTVHTQTQQAPSCTISANPTLVPFNGSTTVTWNSTNAASATLTDAGFVSTSGSRTFSNINGSRTFTLVVTGFNGTTNSCTTSVSTFTQPPSGNLFCTLTASPNIVTHNGTAVLNWTSQNAVSATLSDGIGFVATNGSLAVRPESNRHYTLTVRDQNGNTQQCSALVSVGNSQFISLTQVPRTGPGEASTIVTMLALLGLAGAGGYVLISRKEDILALPGLVGSLVRR